MSEAVPIACDGSGDTSPDERGMMNRSARAKPEARAAGKPGIPYVAKRD
jgi:hypothetical protein